jgi:hypothetical protein
MTMPYSIRKQDGRHVVVKDDDGAVMGRHETEAQAQAQVRALYATEDDQPTKAAPTDDSLVSYGESVKALDGFRIGGLLAPFGSPAEVDAARDYFTAETDFGLDVSRYARVIVHHGFTKAFGRRKIGVVGMDLTERGVEAAEPLALDPTNPAHRTLYEDATKGRLFWSTGTAPHLMERVPEGHARRVTAWPITEASLTYTPVNRGAVAQALKALIDSAPDGLLDTSAGSGSVAARSLSDRLTLLVADAREVVALATKARDQRAAEGRSLSLEKIEAIAALTPEIAELADALKALAAPPTPQTDPRLEKIERLLRLGRLAALETYR